MTPMVSTEIHIPASPTRRFADMLFFLVHSIAAHADLPGPWKVVVTLGRDGALHADSPELSWARAFPVEFRQVAQEVWARHERRAQEIGQPAVVYSATGSAQFDREFEADVVLFLDADTIVLRSLAALIGRVRAEGCLAAKPAWQPPDVDLDALIAARGLVHVGPPMTYSGYGWQFMEPRFGPPYFNFGVLACPRVVANLMRDQLPAELEFVNARRFSWFGWQMALTLMMVRTRTPFLELDERYNYGIGETEEFTPSLLAGEEGRRLEQLGREQARDIHVLHYCTETPNFVRNTVMGHPDRLRRFCARADLLAGERKLQAALRPFMGAWEAWQARLAASGTDAGGDAPQRGSPA
jgi:hypothetical protein